jgi:hypothetical protein
MFILFKRGYCAIWKALRNVVQETIKTITLSTTSMRKDTTQDLTCSVPVRSPGGSSQRKKPKALQPPAEISKVTQKTHNLNSLRRYLTHRRNIIFGMLRAGFIETTHAAHER